MYFLHENKYNNTIRNKLYSNKYIPIASHVKSNF